MYTNLKAELLKRKITVTEVASYLGLSRADVSHRLHNFQNKNFTLKQGIAIKKKFFPDLSVEYLFETDV